MYCILICNFLTGRWNKRQLDPLMVFGIRCHLQYKFNISSKLWHRICQNMDSKCRSAWKRRMRGMVNQQLRNNRVKIKTFIFLTCSSLIIVVHGVISTLSTVMVSYIRFSLTLYSFLRYILQIPVILVCDSYSILMFL